MLETDSTPDRWINFVLQNGWRLNARVNEETGDLSVSVSNENGIVDSCNMDYRLHEESIEPDGTSTFDFSVAEDAAMQRMVPDGNGGFKIEDFTLAEEFKQLFKLRNEEESN